VKAIKGSERLIIDPLESVIKNTYPLRASSPSATGHSERWPTLADSAGPRRG